MTPNDSPETTPQEGAEDVFYTVTNYLAHVPGCPLEPCDCGMVEALALMTPFFLSDVHNPQGLTADQVAAKHREAVRRNKATNKAA